VVFCYSRTISRYNQGVELILKTGAGDQGMMFGYATYEMACLALICPHKLLQELAILDEITCFTMMLNHK
jgi:S-adenosylmethionine synthetase